MTNPWLKIPASDYEEHMRSPSVSQLAFIGEQFGKALEQFDSSSIALLGCATGNGLENIENEKSDRLTVVDINPDYLNILRERYEAKISGLEVVEADLENYSLENDAYSLVFAALIFEYVDARNLLKNITGALKDGGALVTVLQLPCDNLSNVTDTPYKSLESLKSIMKLVDPTSLKNFAMEEGLMMEDEKEITLHTGKSFYIGTYRKK